MRFASAEILGGLPTAILLTFTLHSCVTGAGGFIASHLAKRLKLEGHYVVGVDWKKNEHMAVSVPRGA